MGNTRIYRELQEMRADSHSLGLGIQWTPTLRKKQEREGWGTRGLSYKNIIDERGFSGFFAALRVLLPLKPEAA